MEIEEMNDHQKLLWNDLNHVAFKGSIFKYSSAENGILCLKNSTLYFKSPLDFNDDKDCDPTLISVSDRYINQILKESGRPTPVSQRTHPKEYAKFKALAYKSLRTELLPNTKITCFSEFNDTYLMWELYSADHSGICIEFDTSQLMDIPLHSTPRFRYKVRHPFRSKVHQYSAGKVTNYSAAKYATLLEG